MPSNSSSLARIAGSRRPVAPALAALLLGAVFLTGCATSPQRDPAAPSVVGQADQHPTYPDIRYDGPW